MDKPNLGQVTVKFTLRVGFEYMGSRQALAFYAEDMIERGKCKPSPKDNQQAECYTKPQAWAESSG